MACLVGSLAVCSQTLSFCHFSVSVKPLIVTLPMEERSRSYYLSPTSLLLLASQHQRTAWRTLGRPAQALRPNRCRLFLFLISRRLWGHYSASSTGRRRHLCSQEFPTLGRVTQAPQHYRHRSGPVNTLRIRTLPMKGRIEEDAGEEKV